MVREWCCEVVGCCEVHVSREVRTPRNLIKICICFRGYVCVCWWRYDTNCLRRQSVYWVCYYADRCCQLKHHIIRLLPCNTMHISSNRSITHWRRAVGFDLWHVRTTRRLAIALCMCVQCSADAMHPDSVSLQLPITHVRCRSIIRTLYFEVDGLVFTAVLFFNRQVIS